MNLYVSYSPADTELVAAVVAMLSANNRALVCLDADAIRTTGRWQEELGPAIAAADVVLLFWCHHANVCYELRKEFAVALERGRDVLPLLLDDTPLPARLAGLRAIDVRSRIGVLHEPSSGAQTAGTSAREAADRMIAGDLARGYEDLLLLGIAREIEAELAARLGPRAN